jgi:hypothetical protein
VSLYNPDIATMEADPIPHCGTYVSVNIDAKFLFDESEWDSYLATLRYEKPSANCATSL